MDNKRIHKIVVLKHGNHYSLTGIKHITQKTSRIIRRRYNQTGTDWYRSLCTVEKYSLAICM